MKAKAEATRIGGTHSAILSAIRLAAAAEGVEPTISARVSALSDRELLRLMFMSLRTARGETHGMRLTAFGLTVMLAFYKAFDMALPKDHPPTPADILYLDSRAAMPYFCSKERLVVFETQLGVKLRLADGMIGTLRDMDVEFRHPATRS